MKSPDLDWAAGAGVSAAQQFGRSAVKTLSREQATLEAVRETSPSCSHLYFYCHGSYDWRDALQSGLALTNGQRLTLAELLGCFDLSRARLVTLAACETGIIDINQSPDEYIGLRPVFYKPALRVW